MDEKNRKEIEADQSRWLKSLVLDTRPRRFAPKVAEDELESLRGKYIGLVEYAISRFFPLFSKTWGFTDAEIRKTFRGRGLLFEAPAAMQDIFHILLDHVSGKRNSKAWVDLLYVERAIFLSRLAKPTDRTPSQITEKLESIKLGQRRFRDENGLFFVKLSTDLLERYPDADPRKTKSLGAPVVAVIFRKPRSGLKIALLE